MRQSLAARFYRETAPSFQIALELNYTLFDFGAVAGGSTPKARASWHQILVLTTCTAS
jgi:hypothetical protein